MFKKRFRLNRELLGKKTGRFRMFKTSFFLLRINKNDLLYNRYGFVVSKKIDKRSVVRNKIKRALRACVEKLSNKLGTGYDILFIVQKNYLQNTDIRICSHVEEVLKKEKLLI